MNFRPIIGKIFQHINSGNPYNVLNYKHDFILSAIFVFLTQFHEQSADTHTHTHTVPGYTLKQARATSVPS
jgi:hypothetical protein